MKSPKSTVVVVDGIEIPVRGYSSACQKVGEILKKSPKAEVTVITRFSAAKRQKELFEGAVNG